MRDLNPLYAPDDGAAPAATDAPVADAASVKAPNPHSDVVPAVGMSRYGTPITGETAQAEPAVADEISEPAPPAEEDATSAKAPAPSAEATEAADAAPADDATAEGTAQPAEADEPVDIVAAIRRAVPGAPVTSEAEVAGYVGELYQHAQGMSDLRQIVSEVPELATFFQAINDGNKPRMAAVEAFRELAAIPDQLDDPELWGEWNRKQGMKEAEQRLAAERDAKLGTRSEQRRAHIEATKQSFAKRNPEANPDAVHAELLSLIDGDQLTGRFRGDAFDMVHLAMNHDSIVKQEVTKAREQARTELMAEIRAQNKTASAETPLAVGGGGSAVQTASEVDPSSLSPDQQRAHQLAVALHGRTGRPGQMSRYGTRIN